MTVNLISDRTDSTVCITAALGAQSPSHNAQASYVIIQSAESSALLSELAMRLLITKPQGPEKHTNRHSNHRCPKTVMSVAVSVQRVTFEPSVPTDK